MEMIVLIIKMADLKAVVNSLSWELVISCCRGAVWVRRGSLLSKLGVRVYTGGKGRGGGGNSKSLGVSD